MNKHSIDIAMVLCYNLAVLSGTAYLVQFHDWSGWWFLFSGLCMLSIKTKED